MSTHNLEMKLINADLKLKRKTNVTYERLIQDVNDESDKKENMCMENTQLDHVFSNSEPKSLYLYDFLNMNIFYIDLIEISKKNQSSDPVILNTFGEYEIQQNINIF